MSFFSVYFCLFFAESNFKENQALNGVIWFDETLSDIPNQDSYTSTISGIRIPETPTNSHFSDIKCCRVARTCIPRLIGFLKAVGVHPVRNEPFSFTMLQRTAFS
jgi:hypothetical protein